MAISITDHTISSRCCRLGSEGDACNMFAISLTSTTAAETVPAAISTFPGVSQFTVPYGDIAAATVVVTVPVVLLVRLFQRRIVAGLTAGAVKG